MEKLVQGLPQVWEEPSVQKEAGEGLASLDAPILGAPNYPCEAARTLLLMGYQARNFIIH